MNTINPFYWKEEGLQQQEYFHRKQGSQLLDAKLNSQETCQGFKWFNSSDHGSFQPGQGGI